MLLAWGWYRLLGWHLVIRQGLWVGYRLGASSGRTPTLFDGDSRELMPVAQGTVALREQFFYLFQ